MPIESSIQRPPAAPEKGGGADGASTPPASERALSPEELRKTPGVVIEFLDGLRTFEPEGERASITFRILMLQLFETFKGNTDILWDVFAQHLPTDLYIFLTTSQENPITKKSIPPILAHADKRTPDSTVIADEWKLNKDALEQHLESFLLWVDRERGVKEAQGLSFGHAKNLFVHTVGGKNYFNAAIDEIPTGIEDLRKFERAIKRSIARKDYRSSMFKVLERMGVDADEISIEISGEEKYLQSNSDGTIDIKIDWIEIRNAKLKSGRELTDEVRRQIATGLRLVNIRNPRHTRWITYDPGFEIRFTEGKEEPELKSRVSREELQLDVPGSREEAFAEIGRELNAVTQHRTRILKPHLAQRQLRIVMSDVPHRGVPSEEHFAPPRVEELVKQMMHHDRKFSIAFLSGKKVIAQMFGDELKEHAATPRYKKFFEKRKKEQGADAYTPAKDPTETERTEGVVKITSAEVEIARTVTGKEIAPRTFSDWERREGRRREEGESVPSHHQKFVLLRRFYDALSSFTHPDPRIERLARAVGTVIANESSLAQVGEIGEVLYKLSSEEKNAVSKANTYFNHFYSAFEEMGLATADIVKKEVRLDTEKIAEHAKEFLSGRPLKSGTNIFQLAQTHGLVGKNPEKQAAAIEERIKHEGEANVQLAPEELELVKEFADISEQLRALAFAITIPDPGSPGRDQALAETMKLGGYDALAREVIARVERRDPSARESADRLRKLLAEKFGE